MKQVDLCQAQIDEWASKLANSTDALSACQTQGDALSGQLNSTKTQLSSSQSQTASAQQQFSSCQKNVDMLKANVSVMQSYNAIMQGKLSECQAGLDSLNATLRNAVAAVCCSYGDVQASVVKNWQIQGSSIVCSGSGTVNCATGALG
jgi:chromosome segregation ATPase